MSWVVEQVCNRSQKSQKFKVLSSLSFYFYKAYGVIILTGVVTLCFYEALNSGCMEGDDVICPDSVLSALISHGWFIPTEQQVSDK